MKVTNMDYHEDYDISEMTEEYLYNYLTRNKSINELCLHGKDWHEINNGRIMFALLIKADNYRKNIRNIYMHNKISNIMCCIPENIALYINPYTFESEFWKFEHLAGIYAITGNIKSTKIDRTLPKYWEDTEFNDLVKRTEKVLTRIAKENKDRPHIPIRVSGTRN